MQTTVKPPPTNGPKPPRHSARQLLATRRGLVGVAIFVAVLGAGAIIAFLEEYRDSVAEESRPVTVLVAKGLIGEGTSGDVVATEALFQASEVPESEAQEGALTDPGSLRGRVATEDVFPGQQLTTESFIAGTGKAKSKLVEHDRAISVPVDAAHGLIGVVRAGDRVDVLGAIIAQRGGETRPAVRTIRQDALVLDVPPEETGRNNSAEVREITLRVTDEEALAVAYVAEHGKIWLTLRPPSHARDIPPSAADLETFLAGVRPVTLDRTPGGRR